MADKTINLSFEVLAKLIGLPAGVALTNVGFCVNAQGPAVSLTVSGKAVSATGPPDRDFHSSSSGADLRAAFRRAADIQEDWQRISLAGQQAIPVQVDSRDVTRIGVPVDTPTSPAESLFARLHPSLTGSTGARVVPPPHDPRPEDTAELQRALVNTMMIPRGQGLQDRARQQDMQRIAAAQGLPPGTVIGVDPGSSMMSTNIGAMISAYGMGAVSRTAVTQAVVPTTTPPATPVMPAALPERTRRIDLQSDRPAEPTSPS